MSRAKSNLVNLLVHLLVIKIVSRGSRGRTHHFRGRPRLPATFNAIELCRFGGWFAVLYSSLPPTHRADARGLKPIKMNTNTYTHNIFTAIRSLRLGSVYRYSFRNVTCVTNCPFFILVYALSEFSSKLVIRNTIWHGSGETAAIDSDNYNWKRFFFLA